MTTQPTGLVLRWDSHPLGECCCELQLPSTGVDRLRRYFEPVRHPGRPGLSLAGVRLGVTRPHRLGFPVLRQIPSADMPSPLPRWDRRWDRFAPLKPATTAFPIPLLGRLPH